MVINTYAPISVCGNTVQVYDISVSSNKNPTPKTYYQHRHPAIELHYALAGQFRINYAGKSGILHSDELFFVPPGTYHDLLPVGIPCKKLSISFTVVKLDGANATADTFCQAYANTAVHTVSLNGTEAQNLLRRITDLSESAEADTYKSDKLLALCASLLLELAPVVSTGATDCTQTRQCENSDDVSFKIDSFMARNFMHNNAKSAIASDLYISPRQLQRIIRKNYGISYRQKLAETRLQIAKDLLCYSDMPIHKIAEILGYSCSANFSAFIKRETGKTPSQIRKAGK